MDAVIRDITVAGTTAQRDLAYPTPAGNETWDNTDLGYRQWYNAASAQWEMDQQIIGGAASVTGLATNAVVQGAGTYNATQILGYRVLVQGSANWSETPINGSAQTIPFAAQIIGAINPEHLSSITVGTGGSALLYIPS